MIELPRGTGIGEHASGEVMPLADSLEDFPVSEAPRLLDGRRIIGVEQPFHACLRLHFADGGIVDIDYLLDEDRFELAATPYNRTGVIA